MGIDIDIHTTSHAAEFEAHLREKIRVGNARAAADMERLAVMKAPTKTGFQKGSIQSDSSEDHARAFSNAPYAIYQEEGVKPGRRGSVQVEGGRVIPPSREGHNVPVYKGFRGKHFLRDALLEVFARIESYYR